ncbi:MAG TPA: biopolymer transporter ExbD [Pirellulales bacterium]|jgi:biopolymer transport protein ExbD|nr:biopolymer transporter ExbD [Pirellulales bacterium]
MSASMSHAASAEPNLTPILDMVFQLITFFMLVINFRAQAMDLHLQLPVLGSARPVKPGPADTDVLLLNINSSGQLTVYGHSQELGPYIKSEAEKRLKSDPTLQPGDPLHATIALRADQATPFSLLNRVIKTCQENGFQKFLLKAMNKKEG